MEADLPQMDVITTGEMVDGIVTEHHLPVQRPRQIAHNVSLEEMYILRTVLPHGLPARRQFAVEIQVMRCIWTGTAMA